MARRVFYSFHYVPDNWRVATVRNIGSVEGNRPTTDNNWETIANQGDAAIKRWIANQMNGRSCTVVLIGTNTANRRWINHEIIESWNAGMGVVGIRIHGLKNAAGQVSTMGTNPFDFIRIGDSGKMMSSVVRCYNPRGTDSKEKYNWISQHLENAVAEAIRIRKEN